MKTILISLAAASALAAGAAPAAAQTYGGYGQGMADRGDRLEWRIQRAVERGDISRREAYRLRADVRATEQLAWRYRRDGAFTRWERADIDRRFDHIAMQLRYERADRDYGYRPW
jgi:RecA-family ATPase